MSGRTKAQLQQELEEARRELARLRSQLPALASAVIPARGVNPPLAPVPHTPESVELSAASAPTNPAHCAQNEAERFRILAEAAFEGIVVTDAERIIEANEQFERMHGYGLRETIGMPVRAFVAPEDWEKVAANRRRGWEEPYEHTGITRDGRRRCMEVHGKAMVYQGRPVRVTAVRDLTETRAAEQALRDSQARLKRLVDSNMLGILTWDADGRVTEANDAFLTMVGYTRDDVAAGRVRWDEFTPPEYVERDLQALAEVRATGICKPFEKEIVRADGSRIAVRVGGIALDGEPLNGVSFVVDVTDRKQVEAELRRAHDELELRVRQRTAELESTNEQLREEVAHRQEMARQLREQTAILGSILTTMSDAVVVTDATGRLVAVNPAGARVLNLHLRGMPPIDWLPANPIHVTALSSAYSHDQRPLVRALRGEIVESAEAFLRHEQYPEGVWISGNAQPLFDEQGVVQGAVVVFRDITERRRREAALRDSEERFRQLAENIREVFWIVSLEQELKVIYLSPAFEQTWGIKPQEIFNRPELFLETVHSDDRQRIGESFARLGDEGYSEEYRIVRPDGEVRWIRTRAFPIRDAEGRVYRATGISEDITVARESEAQLRNEQRLLRHLLQAHEQERKLAADELHDNVVQHIIGAGMQIDSLLDRVTALWPEGGRRLDNSLQLLRGSIDEARRMISALRPPIIDERGIVAAIGYLLNEIPGAPEECEFVHELRSDRLPSQLEAVLFRIAQEAWSNVCRHSAARRASIALTQCEHWVQLEVRDWGAGFDCHASRWGSGLRGMSERARLYGGQFSIDSGNDGTQLRIMLPVCMLLEEA